MVLARLIRLLLVVAVAATTALVAPAASAFAGSSQHLPGTVPLPTGFQPEGITSGHGGTFFAGSRRDGSIYRGNLRTGHGRVFIEGDGGVAVGMEYDERTHRLWVAGGDTGTVTVYNARTGRQLRRWTVPAESQSGIFLNDVAVTKRAIYVTDSLAASLVKIPLRRGGSLPGADGWKHLQLRGDFVLTEGFNVNGIRALPGGRALVIVQSSTGALFRVNRRTGYANEVELAGTPLLSGDGLERRGRILYVVYGFARDSVAVVRLRDHGRRGSVVGEISDPDLDRPTTAAVALGRLWAVNGRFAVADDPSTTFEVVRLPLR